MVHVVDLGFVLVALALSAGGIVQGCIGFGMVVVAFPVLVMVEPALMPQTILVVSLPTTLVNAYKNRGEANYREVAWLSTGRIPGLVLGVLLVSRVDRSSLAIAGGLVVLVAVGLSLVAPSLRRNIPTMLTIGGVSALFGTSIGIGGPPLGLLYQHERGPRLRSTISLIMLTGAPVSLLLLAVAGQLHHADVATGAALAPFAVSGTMIAPRFAPWFDERMRKIILVLCASASIVAMAKVLLT